MGIIKAAAAAVGGNLADQWLESIKAENMTDTTVMVKGTQISQKRKGLFTPGSSNTKGSADVISNGSKIQVYPNQMMILIDGGRVVDYTAEEGYYEVFTSQSPSMFNGELKSAVRETFDRFKFGGTPTTNQQAIFINLQEIKGIKFGTRNAIQYFDNFYGAELFIRCHGIYSIKITDPLKFYMNACPRSASRVDINDINEQYLSEFLTALQAAISQMSVDGVRISNLPSKAMELSKYMSKVLDEDWGGERGMEVCSVGVSSISYDDESKNLINMRNQGAMLTDPSIREGYVQGAVAKGLQSAGANTAGAGQAFMGMGFGMNAAGNFMGQASANNYAQMQQNQQAQQNAQGWACQCGQKGNGGKFCANCGAPKPEINAGWLCSCGHSANNGKFCAECGSPKPDTSGWACSCGQAGNSGKFCSNCGKPNN